MTNNAPAPLTYGDTFTLPSAPGIVWEIFDRRTVENPEGNPPAEALPITQNGEPVTYDAAVKVGRAERVGLVIKITRAYYDGSNAIRAYLTARTWEQRPTDAQEKAVDGDLSALTFHAPPLTPAEIVARTLAKAEGAYIYSAVRDATDSLNLPKSYSSAGAVAADVRAALNADPATVPAIRAALVAAFAAEMEKWKP